MSIRLDRLLFALAAILAYPAQALVAQQTASSVLTQAQAAIASSNASLEDITLTGSVEYFTGSTDETGTIVLTALADGSARFDVALPKRTFAESVFVDGPKMHGQSRNEAGEVREIVAHNVMSDAAWFCPGLLVSRYEKAALRGEVSGGTTVTHHGQTALLLTSAMETKTGRASFDSEFRRLSRSHLFIDPTSFLPIAFAHDTHPAYNSLINIPTEARYSQYRTFDGVSVPMHIQRYMNGVLNMDIQLTAAQVNTGLAASTFHLQ